MQSVQLSIPKPCHQNWDKMTPTQQGRFCIACAKQVVDFTTMSDGEVLNYFLNNKTENVCGRTLPQQLNRVLEAPKPITPNKLWYWKYAAAAGFLFFAKGQGVNAQSVTPYTPQQMNTIQNGLVRKVGEIVVINNKVISGRITDKEGKEIPFASVRIKGTNRGVSADANGEYSIKADCDKDVLQVSATGYELNELYLKNNNFNIVLQRVKVGLKGDIVIVGYLGRVNVVDKTPLINLRQRNVAILKVKDSTTGKLISDAKLFIKENYNDFDTIKLRSGTHKINKIREDDVYTIQASKEGYISKAVVITKENFNKRKGVFEIKLEKIKPIVNQVNNKKVTLGGAIITKFSTEPIYVVDGVIDSNGKNIKPNDIEKIEVLKGTAATMLFGQDGDNGAIIITTKKVDKKVVISQPNYRKRERIGSIGIAITDIQTEPIKKDSTLIPKYKLMDEVVVNGKIDKRKNAIVAGLISYAVFSSETETKLICTTEGKNVKSDTLKQKILNLFSPIKVYPNPVKKEQPINISFSNKYNPYAIQIVNASGVVILQQRRQNSFTKADAFSKKITEQIIISPQWNSGYYLINILNEQGKVIAKDGFLVL